LGLIHHPQTLTARLGSATELLRPEICAVIDNLEL